MTWRNIKTDPPPDGKYLRAVISGGSYWFDPDPDDSHQLNGRSFADWNGLRWQEDNSLLAMGDFTVYEPEWYWPIDDLPPPPEDKP